MNREDAQNRPAGIPFEKVAPGEERPPDESLREKLQAHDRASEAFPRYLFQRITYIP